MTDTPADQAPTAADHAQAARDVKRFLHTLRHLAAMADKVEEWVGLDGTIASASVLLAQVREEEQRRATVAALGHIADVEQATAAVNASLLAAKNAEAALQARLAELQTKVDEASAKLADLDKQVVAKRNELGEIEAGLAAWKARLAG